jgi:hypothetical protein
MSTTLSFTAPFHSDPVTIPNSNNTDNNDTDEEQTYKEMIKQLAAQAPEPYGAIPPLIKKKKKKKKEKTNKKEKNKNKKVPPIRRMSHVENWIAVDSKESIPDEEDLVKIKKNHAFIEFSTKTRLFFLYEYRDIHHLFVISCQRIFWCYHYICHHLHLVLQHQK